MHPKTKKTLGSPIGVEIVTEALSGKESSSDFELSEQKITNDKAKEGFQFPKEACTHLYQDTENLNKHIQTAHKHEVVTSEGCTAELSTKRDHEQQIKISHPRSLYKFKQPNKAGPSSSSYRELPVVKVEEIENPIQTDILPETITGDVSTNSELDSDVESVYLYSIKEEKKPKYVCKYPNCSQSFKRMVHLDRHEYKHSGVRQHVCSYEGCSKSYTISTHLKRHISVSHEKVAKTQDIKCGFDFCKKVFTSMHSMVRHMDQIHENPQIYKCSQCDEVFNRRIKLRRHEVKHTGVFPFNCTKCGKGFVQEYFFKIHACRAYKCDQCQTVFDKWSKLMAHRDATKHKYIIHKCDVCAKEYTSRAHLRDHKNTHAEDKEVFACSEAGCTRFYAYKSNLVQHIRTAHEGKRFPCSVNGCEMKLSTKGSLEQHVKSVHSEKKPKSKPKLRAKRKDAGKRKKSALSKMSGVMLDSKLNKVVMEGSIAIEIDGPVMEEEIQNKDDEEQLLVVTMKDLS